MIINKNLRILIVEDNEGFSKLIQLLLQEIGLEKISAAADYESALEVFNTIKPDLCLVDINLGKNKKTGINLAEKIRETHPYLPLIYLTSDYTDECYENSRHTRPSSFMGKELSRFKLEQAIDLALMHTEDAAAIPEMSVANPSVSAPSTLSNNRFFFKIGDVFKSIPTKEVAYFYADNKLTYAHVGSRNYPTNVQLKTLEEEFACSFVRIHKTYLVNVDYIESIHPKEGTVATSGESLPIGYAYRKHFFDRVKLLR